MIIELKNKTIRVLTPALEVIEYDNVIKIAPVSKKELKQYGDWQHKCDGLMIVKENNETATYPIDKVRIVIL